MSGNLPKTSSPMSVFSYYLLSRLIASLCLTLETIISVYLYYTGEREQVTKCLSYVLRTAVSSEKRHVKESLSQKSKLITHTQTDEMGRSRL